MGLLFHPATRRAIDSFLASPAGAVLLQATSGSGKGSLARYMAAELLEVPFLKVEDNPNIHIIAKDGESISIEDVRSISSFLKLKTTGSHTYRRAVIVEYAEKMGIEAQNAFLKGLEEPPSDTSIILTTNNPELLLSTITSRVQLLNVLAPNKPDTLNHFSDQYTVEAISKAYLLSEGAIGLMTALLTDNKSHPLIAQIDLAKDIYKKSVFERLNLIDDITKKVDIPGLLIALERVSHAALRSSAERADKSVEAWTNRLKLILETQNYLRHNPNSKLLLTNLLINL